ncbi:MAG: hypothetical protein Kow00117_21520 [Phototrophicales bacterium]
MTTGAVSLVDLKQMVLQNIKDLNFGIQEPILLLMDDDGMTLKGDTITLTKADLGTAQLQKIAKSPADLVGFFSLPLVTVDDIWVGAILFKSSTELNTDARHILTILARNSAAALYNWRYYQQTEEELKKNVIHLKMLQQLDSELNETLTSQRVFEMTLDWVMRFTNARTAFICMYSNDSLIVSHSYGFAYTDEVLQKYMLNENTITLKAAQTKTTQIVTNMKDHLDVAWQPEFIKAELAVPIMRDERVIGVLTLGCRHEGGFEQAQVAFVEQLVNRAAIAIDNAYLHTKTVQEHERLSSVLDSIADVVIVVDADGTIVRISQSAIMALRLFIGQDYVGEKVSALEFSPLLRVYERALQSNEQTEAEELKLPNGRDYHTRIVSLPMGGHTIVMQDITAFKETDRLKSELVATVSHDLKQPLSVMRGYVDLLQMKNTFDASSMNFIHRLENSINSMRQLIDDLLDLARIESGVSVTMQPVKIKPILMQCVESHRSDVESKAMTLTVNLPDDLPEIEGEEQRLQQIFNNLISNAIKYTPPEGWVKISAEVREATLRIIVQDSGLGISPEDQPRIFDRFYRVRRPETDSIDGTGLGLAIVKKLVEMHQGKIRLESKLGEGSTFVLTFPVKVLHQ